MKKIFTDDPMMSELHAIREEHYLKSKALPLSERSRRMGEKENTFLFSYGYKLVPTKRGTRKLVKAA